MFALAVLLSGLFGGGRQGSMKLDGALFFVFRGRALIHQYESDAITYEFESLVANNSLHVNISTICRVGFICAQALIETK